MRDTQRLIFRSLVQADADAFRACLGDREVMQYEVMETIDASLYIEAFILCLLRDERSIPRTRWNFGVVERSTNLLIGFCTLLIVDRGTAEVGRMLRRDRWGQGYGTETAHELLHFGFERLGLQRLLTRCSAENLLAIRSMERVGLCREPQSELRQLKGRQHEWLTLSLTSTAYKH